MLTRSISETQTHFSRWSMGAGYRTRSVILSGTSPAHLVRMDRFPLARGSFCTVLLLHCSTFFELRDLCQCSTSRKNRSCTRATIRSQGSTDRKLIIPPPCPQLYWWITQSNFLAGQHPSLWRILPGYWTAAYYSVSGRSQWLTK